MELSPIYQKISDLNERSTILSDHLQLEEKQGRLEEVLRELENPDIWSNPEEAQALGKEKNNLENVCNTFSRADAVLSDASELLEMAETENDPETVESVVADLHEIEIEIGTLEFQRMFSGEMDKNSA